jgi:hypothetical protein
MGPRKRSDKWRDLASALAFLVLLWLAGNANAQCVPEALPGRVATLPHAPASRPNSPGDPLSRVSCGSFGVTHSLAQRRVPNESVVVARSLGAQIERGAEPQSSFGVSTESAVAARLSLRWRNLQAPRWSGTVPDWVMKDAVNYRRRGLPLVHLWQSTNYQLAVGLSNHRVPGIYFLQKVP